MKQNFYKIDALPTVPKVSVPLSGESNPITISLLPFSLQAKEHRSATRLYKSSHDII